LLSCRVRRLLALLLVAVGGAILPPRWLPAESGKASLGVPILFDSAFVKPTVFSPNGDFAFDSVAVFYTLPESATVFIYVTVEGSAQVLRILDQRLGLRPEVQYRLEWRGEDTSGRIQPEGNYTVHFTGTTVTGQGLTNQRQVRIDLSSPIPQLLEVHPRRWAAGLPQNANVFPFIRVRITGSELEDGIGVAVLDAQGAARDTLDPEGGFGGDGDYIFVCHTCGLSSFEDGVYKLLAFGLDSVGNDSTVVDSLDKNVLGPAITVSHPPTPRAVQHADSLVGVAVDRQLVVSMQGRVVVGADTTTIDLPPRDGGPGTTYRFFMDLGTLLSAEGDYPFQLLSRDEDGVPDTLLFRLRVDRTAPPAPVPAPPLPEVTKTQVLTGNVVVDTTDTSRIVVIGGVTPPETLSVLHPTIRFSRTLASGTNRISFQSIDRARNISAANTSTVVWDAASGIAAPERFSAGQSIEVNVGGVPARGVFVRILAMDGSLVQTFQDPATKSYYRFTWDLRTPEGRDVRNGAYLVLARVVHSDGGEERLRTMIAVVR